MVIGAVCRVTKSIRVKISRVRNTLSINLFITQNIESGSQIMVDGWREYLHLPDKISLYGCINHGLHYVDPLNDTIHINNIERS